MEARITAQSQSFKLRERLEEAKVSHGQEVRADLPNVRVGVLAATGEAQLMFCNMGSIRVRELLQPGDQGDRKSTRLNSSHSQISYAVFCLKKKKRKQEALSD